MLAPDDATMAMMHDAASGRAALWRLCAEIASPPTEDFVARLRDGRLGREVAEHSRWIGDDSPFEDLLLSLGAFRDHASDTGLEGDVEALRTEWHRLALGDEVARTCGGFAERADEEAQAWRAGDHVVAKDLRVRQFRAMEAALEPIAKWCQRADAATELLIMQVLVRIVAAQATAESGRDLLGDIERRGSRTATPSFWV